MKKFILFAIILLLAACSSAPSDEDIQKAIEETQTYNQTATALADVKPIEITKVVPQTVEVTRIVERTVQVTQVVKQTVLVSQGDGGEGESATYTGTDYPPLGEEYSAGGYFLIVESIEDPATPVEYHLDKINEGEKLVAVMVVIGNRSGAVNYISSSYFNLVDTDGFVYDEASVSHSDGSGFNYIKDMNPGEKGRGWITFILPLNSVPDYIKYNLDRDTWLYAGLHPE